MLTNYVEENSQRSMEQRDKDRANFFKKFQNLLMQFDYVVLFNHVGPDGDCLGSSFGFQELMKANFPKKKVYVTGSNYGLYPWMNMQFDNVINYDFDFSKAIAVIIDVGQSVRIQQFDKFFKNSKISFGAVVKIDHHGSPSDFHVDLSWDDPTYVAACCQVAQIADFYGWKVTPRAATFLYLGICTDSLRFAVDNVLPRSLILAAKMWRAGADHVTIHRHLLSRTWKEIKLDSYLLGKANKTDNIIWYLLTHKEIEDWRLKNTKGLVSVFQNIEDHWIWILFVETENNMVDVDLRSVNVSVRDLAIKYGGGGHENASGCKIDKDKIQNLVDDAEKMVADAKRQMDRDRMIAGQDPIDIEREKNNILRTSPKLMDDVKDLLRDIKSDKKSDWESN